MKKLISFSIVALIYCNSAFSEEELVVALPENNIFVMSKSAACKGNPNLWMCRGKKPYSGTVKLYCNTSKSDCSRVDKRLTIRDFIASERSLAPSCIASINHKIIVTSGKVGKYISYKLKREAKC